MMDHQQNVVDKCKCHCHFFGMKCVSWSAIIIGALVGVGLGFLLNLFSIAIGLSAYTMTSAGGMTVAVGGLIGIIIGVFVSMYVAGWTAGYLGRPYCAKRHLGVLYGFITWCLALLITVLSADALGHYVADYADFVTNPSSIFMTNAPLVNTHVINTQTLYTVTPTSSIAIGALIVFILFFIGALGACFGGHYGMSCRSEGSICGCCDK